MQNSNEQGQIEQLISNLKLEDKTTTASNLVERPKSSPKAVFIINTPIAVPEKDSYSDSDNSDDEENFPDSFFEFDVNDEETYPFKIIKRMSQKKRLINDVIENIPVDSAIAIEPSKKQLVENFLDKLSKEELNHTCSNDGTKLEIEQCVGVIFTINRMKSLSSKKNNDLMAELKLCVNNRKNKITQYKGIHYKRYVSFWKPQWIKNKKYINKKQDEEVSFDQAKKFYRQLKRHDKKGKTEKANKFLAICENMKNDNFAKVPVPYQYLREYTRIQSRIPVKYYRKVYDENIPIYLATIDYDVVDFNGIFNAYYRLIGENNFPTVMTTGYEYPIDEEKTHVYQKGSQIDRNIRIETTKYLPLGAYFPEPNLCILIPPEKLTVPESFIDRTRGYQLESAIIINNIYKTRPNATFVFSNYSPIITTIPGRAKRIKRKGALITFSKPFEQHAPADDNDIQKLKQISQSHFKELAWVKYLFINLNFKLKRKDRCTLNSLLTKLMKQPKNKKIYKEASKILNDIDNSLMEKIRNAIDAVNSCIEKFKIDYIRSEDDDKLLSLLEDQGIEIKNIYPEKSKILQQNDVLELIEDNNINIHQLVNLSNEVLNYILSDTIVFALQTNEINEQDFEAIMDIAKDCDLFNDFKSVLNNKDFELKEILEAYYESASYLKIMAEHTSPQDIISENIDNIGLVRYFYKKYDNKVQWDEIYMGIVDDYEHDEDEQEKYISEFRCTYEQVMGEEYGLDFSTDSDELNSEYSDFDDSS